MSTEAITEQSTQQQPSEQQDKIMTDEKPTTETTKGLLFSHVLTSLCSFLGCFRVIHKNALAHQDLPLTNLFCMLFYFFFCPII